MKIVMRVSEPGLPARPVVDPGMQDAAMASSSAKRGRPFNHGLKQREAR
jgi:hypothetical protein